MSSPAVQLRSRMPRIAQEIAPKVGKAAQKARLTVVPRRRTRAPRLPFVALVSMVLLAGVVGLLLFNTSMQQASFAATSLEEQARVLNARQQTLQMEIDALRDPQHVAMQAQSMGMVPGGVPGFIDARTGKVEGEAIPAGPLNRLRLLPQPPAKPSSLISRTRYVDAPAAAAGSEAVSNSSGDTGARNGDTRGAGDTHGTKPNRTQNRR